MRKNQKLRDLVISKKIIDILNNNDGCIKAPYIKERRDAIPTFDIPKDKDKDKDKLKKRIK